MACSCAAARTRAMVTSTLQSALQLPSCRLVFTCTGLHRAPMGSAGADATVPVDGAAMWVGTAGGDCLARQAYLQPCPAPRLAALPSPRPTRHAAAQPHFGWRGGHGIHAHHLDYHVVMPPCLPPPRPADPQACCCPTARGRSSGRSSTTRCRSCRCWGTEWRCGT